MSMTSSTARVLLHLADVLDAERPNDLMQEHPFPDEIWNTTRSSITALIAALKAPAIATGETRTQYAARLRDTVREGRP